MQANKNLIVFKLVVAAGSATAAPPIGPALGQRGVPIPDFIRQFNEGTASMEKGSPVPTTITFDKKSRALSMTFGVPPVSYLIMKAAGLSKGSQTPLKEIVGSITRAQAEEIANKKMQDLNSKSIEGAINIIIGSAKSMGIDVVED